MNKKNTSELGVLGEDIAVKFLKGKGLSVVGRNYREKWGEIDVIAKQGEKFRFVEVKAVEERGYAMMPEENVHEKKLQRLFRTIQTYLAHGREGAEWQLDVLAVFIDKMNKTARVRFTENVLLE
ncbi:YraN family protein [Candidatus Parcubacteria bacterium]|nr:YraN family protein [Candidatus Parcubacteria bacterium]